MTTKLAGINGALQSTTLYDVAILGTGLAGTILGAILARNGVKVLMLDAETHPRFALGESTISYTSALLRIVAARYDVPEIQHLSSFANVRKHVARTSGIKRNFGFVYHRPGKKQDPTEVNQFVIPGLLHVENHYFRQDIDMYMLNAAVRYGADLHVWWRVKHVEINGSEVRLHSDKGQEFRARYVVDASGYRSPLAQQFNLREDPCPMKHHARCLFTHMIGVKYYDEVAPDGLRPPVPWHTGTCHHIFDGGWIWVIPFNNHKTHMNPLCSVGLSLDSNRFPKPEGITPEQEFREFISQFPHIEPQFREARKVREWVSTGRLQFSSKETVGDRWCLTSHAAGALDALYSRGLTNTMEVINAIAWRLLAAVKDDDFSVDRFAYIDRLQKGLLSMNDDLIYMSYVSFRDFHMWNASFRVWALASVLSTFMAEGIYDTFRRKRDPKIFDQIEESPRLGVIFPDHPPLYDFMDQAMAEGTRVAEGQADSAKAGDHIFDMLKSADFIPPVFGFHDPKERFYHPTIPRMLKTAWWTQTAAPKPVIRATHNATKAFLRMKIRGD